MNDLFNNYIKSIAAKFAHEETSEMGYRADFELLLKSIFESINVHRIDHDAKAKQGNKPDFVVLNKDVPILYVEAKDIGVSLDKVEKISYKNGKIFINSEQYFGDVPEIAWDFYIGGYQPAQKWLKDRKGRTLTNENIEHYQKIIVTLVETDRIMKEIDKVLVI